MIQASFILGLSFALHYFCTDDGMLPYSVLFEVHSKYIRERIIPKELFERGCTRMYEKSILSPFYPSKVRVLTTRARARVYGRMNINTFGGVK